MNNERAAYFDKKAEEFKLMAANTLSKAVADYAIRLAREYETLARKDLAA